jgi:hypothetical protein
MVNFLNAGALGGGFRHYSGLVPANLGSGDGNHASVRTYHVPASNAAAIFRGDIVAFASSAIGVQGAADLPFNITAPSNSVVVGGGGGSGLGNPAMAPNVTRWVPGDVAATTIIAGVVVGFGPITLYMAKNGFQYIPVSTEAWVSVETDPDVEMYCTVPTVPGTAFALNLNSGADLKPNAGQQSARYGISGVSLDPAFALTATLPLRVLSTGRLIGDDPTAAGFVAKVTFNKSRHFRGSAAFVATRMAEGQDASNQQQIPPPNDPNAIPSPQSQPQPEPVPVFPSS